MVRRDREWVQNGQGMGSEWTGNRFRMGREWVQNGQGIGFEEAKKGAIGLVQKGQGMGSIMLWFR